MPDPIEPYRVRPIADGEELLAALRKDFTKGPTMTAFPNLQAEAIRRGWTEGHPLHNEIRARADLLPEYDNEFEAQRLLEQADLLPSENPGALVILAEAQTHATLHLAKLVETLIEEQRTGNLIAWSIRPGHKPSAETQKAIETGLGR